MSDINCNSNSLTNSLIQKKKKKDESQMQPMQNM